MIKQMKHIVYFEFSCFVLYKIFNLLFIIIHPNQSKMGTKFCTRKRLMFIIPSVCICIGAVLLIISLGVLPSVLKSSIEDQLKLAPDTYEYWGQSPGKTNSVTKRNFTFFNFTNPRQFLYQNKTPIFHQIHGYMLQQRFNFTDYKYSQNQSEVFFNYWLYFTPLDGSRNLDQKINVVNIAPLGFWYQLDKVGMPTFALQGFGGLYVQLSQTFKIQAIGQGVSSQFLPNLTNWQLICNNLQISQIQCNNTWEDPQHGLNDQNNYQIWVQFSYLGQNQAEIYLKTYFGFNDLQMQSLKLMFKEWSITLNQILNNWFCDQKDCSSNDLTLLQLSSGQVTSNPPSGAKVDSICDTGNVTCIGEPQISKFLKNQFKKKHPEDKYQVLTFSIETFKHLFTPYTGTLLNIGTLTTLFETGSRLDQCKDQQQREKYLSQIQQLTMAKSNDHAFVIWEWVKYFTSQFVLKLGKGGSQKNSGIGGVFAQALYQSFTDFGNWIIDEYMNILGSQAIKDCHQFAKNTIEGISDDKINKICSLVDKNNQYSKLFYPCLNSIDYKQQFRQNISLSITQFAQYCDQNEQSFYRAALSIHERLFNQFNCSSKKNVKICSQYELSMKQFINSTITLKPIQNSVKTYPRSLSAKEWNSDLSWFEYRVYLKQFYGNQNFDSAGPKISELNLTDLLSFDKLFSASMIMQLMLEKDKVNFQKLYHWKNMTYLKNFIKFITIQTGFGGFTQSRSPRELLFGYEDPFLKTLQQTDTMAGGDPSIDPIVMLNEPNITLQQASLYPQSIYTGYSDIKLTRQYSTLFNISYITYNKTWYDGSNIKSQFVSPYKQNVSVQGSDSIQNPPGLTSQDSIYCLITNIYRTAKLDYKQDTSMYGVDLLKYTVDQQFLKGEQFYEPNVKYYQKFTGFHNVSFLGVPLHISKNNFYDCPSNWSHLISVYDEYGKYKINGTVEDDTALKVQPNTGALFFATVRLQTNYHFLSDELFTPGSRMLPVTNVIREGQVDQETVNELFGDLKFALNMKNALLIIAIAIFPLNFLIMACACYQLKTKDKSQAQIQQNLIKVKDSDGSLMTQNLTQGSVVSIKTQNQSSSGDSRQNRNKSKQGSSKSKQSESSSIGFYSQNSKKMRKQSQNQGQIVMKQEQSSEINVNIVDQQSDGDNIRKDITNINETLLGTFNQ